MTPVMPINALADGEMTVCRTADGEVLVCRVDGRYFAVSSRCPHAGQSLIGGRLRGFELRCPLHAASFDVRDGRRQRGPSEEDLVCYPVHIENGRVHVDAGRRD
ncbi:MAG: Rieske 2Fe-2S domain-containing protein [Pseudomonadales bacterium]